PMMARAEQGARQAAEEPVDRELLGHYLAGGGEKLAALEAALAAARSGEAGAGDALRRALHKLAGSAGTYGFAELGRQARGLEMRVQSADEPLPEDLLLDTVAFRRELEDTFEEARSRLAGGPPPPLSAIRQKLVVAVIGGGRRRHAQRDRPAAPRREAGRRAPAHRRRRRDGRRPQALQARSGGRLFPRRSRHEAPPLPLRTAKPRQAVRLEDHRGGAESAEILLFLEITSAISAPPR